MKATFLTLIGLTGMGKSTAGNALVGRPVFKTGASREPETAVVVGEQSDAVLGLTVFDTPGLADPRGRSLEFFKSITNHLHANGGLLVYVTKPGRMSQDQIDALAAVDMVTKGGLQNCVYLQSDTGQTGLPEYESWSSFERINKIVEECARNANADYQGIAKKLAELNFDPGAGFGTNVVYRAGCEATNFQHQHLVECIKSLTHPGFAKKTTYTWSEICELIDLNLQDKKAVTAALQRDLELTQQARIATQENIGEYRDRKYWIVYALPTAALIDLLGGEGVASFVVALAAARCEYKLPILEARLVKLDQEIKNKISNQKNDVDEAQRLMEWAKRVRNLIDKPPVNGK